MAPTCNYVKKNGDGIKQFAYLVHYFMLFCGRFVVYCLMMALATMAYSRTKKKSIAFDGSMFIIFMRL